MILVRAGSAGGVLTARLILGFPVDRHREKPLDSFDGVPDKFALERPFDWFHDAHHRTLGSHGTGKIVFMFLRT